MNVEAELARRIVPKIFAYRAPIRVGRGSTVYEPKNGIVRPKFEYSIKHLPMSILASSRTSVT